MQRTTGMLLAGLLVAAPAAVGCSALGGPDRGPVVVASADAQGLTPVRFDATAATVGAAPGEVPTVVVRRGTTVVLTVGSDRARRVLVPEQGRTVNVTAGGTVSIRFLALGTLTVRVAEPGADQGGTVIGRVEPRH